LDRVYLDAALHADVVKSGSFDLYFQDSCVGCHFFKFELQNSHHDPTF